MKPTQRQSAAPDAPFASGARWLSPALLTVLLVWGNLTDAQVPPPLFTPASTFQATNRYVAASVFHWYTANSGQLSGPWRPLEGRPNWAGEPDWWQG